MRLQHNIMAQSSYRNYKKNVSGMKKNLERLASGYKVNRAADDAAGLAISEKMRAQIAGEETAQKNAKDGISLVQTAEGALAEVHDILDRMAELATQSANGTYDSDTDRYQLQKEMGLLLDEINRIADSSNFNGIPLLDGSMDAGGGVVFTPGSFQIDNSTLHPAGPDAGSIELPGVGPTLGQDTVLHTKGTLGNSTNEFSIDLHNVILNANSTISISVGDGVSITVTNNSDEPVTAKDIAAAIAGDSSKKISVDFGDAKVGVSERGSATVTLGKDSVFEMKASGTRVTFAQTNGSDIEMPKEVSIADATAPLPDVTAPSGVPQVQEPTESSPAKYTIDLSGVSMSAPGWVTVGILGREFDLEVTADEFYGSTPVGTVLADKLADALNDASFPPDTTAGALSFSSSDGKLTVAFEKKGEGMMPSDYADKLGSVTVETSVYKDSEPLPELSELLDFGDPDGEEDTYLSSINVEIGGTTYDFTIYSERTAPDDIDLNDPKVIVVTLEDARNGKSMEVIQKQFQDKLNMRLAKDSLDNKKHNANYDEYVRARLVKVEGGYKVEYESVKKTYIGVSDDSGNSGSGGGPEGPGGSGGPAAASKNFSGDYNKSTTVLQTRSGGAQDRLASTSFDLKKLADSDGYIAEGTTITIGRDTYTFTYDANKIGKDGYVALNSGDDLGTAAEKLTKAAERNGTYTVGWDEQHDGGKGRITITEREGQTYFDLTTMEGIEKSLGFKNAATTPASGAKGMTLQIGDGDDIYSQLKISVKDCHTKALGIDAISIATQADAAAATYPIRRAKDYVSDVRGTLGAAQNRLEHTINNLGVMVENIQESESAIRDADIAEEMMSYTKNNILIQSAQSMLAQANQVPQGVLQMLQ